MRIYGKRGKRLRARERQRRQTITKRKSEVQRSRKERHERNHYDRFKATTGRVRESVFLESPRYHRSPLRKIVGRLYLWRP